ncbi:TPA: hypothetical protein ACHOY0_001642 [Raoultella ornithinolytica]
MTSKLTITRERLSGIARGEKCYTHDDVIELALAQLSAMDSEPYGYVNQFLYEQNGVSGLSNDHEYYHDSKSHIPLYRHAQQSVVPDEMPMPNPLSMYAVDAVAAIAEVKGWNACRAAMLNGGQS